MKNRFRLRLIFRSLLLRRRRLSIALLALAVGAALASALLSTYADLEHKMAGEFRRYGANLLVSPGGGEETMPAETLDTVEGAGVTAVPFLYAVGRVNDRPVVLAGTDFHKLREFSRSWKVDGKWGECLAGERLGARPGDVLRVALGGASTECRIAGVLATGASEDSQLLLSLERLQQMAAAPGRLSLVQINAPPQEVESVRARLAAALPGREVRALRPVAESTARVLMKVRATLFGVSLLILAIVGLGVMTTLSATVLERRKDIGVMKALGAAQGHIAALFIAESAVLGAVGGLAGYFGGLVLAQWIGRSIYGAPVSVRAEVLPAVLLVTVALAVVSTLFPLRLVRRVNPAVILRGE